MFNILSFLFIPIINGLPLYMDYQVQEDYVPIVGYHDIEKDFVDDSLTTTIKNFREQVKMMAEDMSCNFITMERLAYYVKNGEKLPTNACIINFDDGASNQYHNTLCTLNEHKAVSTYYIAHDNIQTQDYYMSYAEMDHLHEIGHDMQAHTLTHARLSDLTKEQQMGEILGSKVELETRGYNVSTFAYPYGNFDERTEEILRDSSFILARDTEQDHSWKDKRSPVVSYNNITDLDAEYSNQFTYNYMLHFYYIKPEIINATELHDIMKYTGWWQFEDNYAVVNGQWGIARSSAHVATDTSYVMLKMRYENDEIATPFITKYEGSFTLDILAYNSSETIDFIVKVDDIEYEVYAHEPDSEYSLKYTNGDYDWYNFYINIDNLEPGVHKLGIVKKNNNHFFLDKFRLFSNVNQTFSYKSYYRECNSGKYCSCDSLLDDIFDWDKFWETMANSSLLLFITIIIVSFFVCCVYFCFNSNKKRNINKRNEEEVIEVEVVEL